MSKFTSLSDLKKRDEDAEQSGKKSNEYYSGGNDARGGGSGLSVTGPPNKDDALSKIINNAKMAAGQSAPEQASEGGVTHTITIYRNGFTVDDGPFRDPEEEQNKKFLADVSKGFIPAEFVEEVQTKGAHNVNIVLSDKRQEDYVPPATPKYVAFSGGGATLSSAPIVRSAGGVITLADLAATPVPPLDPALPSTTVQVKLADGKKLKVKINTGSSVLQLMAACHSQAGAPPAGSCAVSAGFPPVEVDDVGKSLVAAGLVGASISQRIV